MLAMALPDVEILAARLFSVSFKFLMYLSDGINVYYARGEEFSGTGSVYVVEFIL